MPPEIHPPTMRPKKTRPPKIRRLGDEIYGTVRAGTRLLQMALGLFKLIPLQSFRMRFGVGDFYDEPMRYFRYIARIFGLNIHVRGTPSSKKPTLFIANHSSYFDIFTLGSILKGSFVAKSEIAGWPFFGYMCRLQNTVFVERQAGRAGAQKNAIRERLEAGDNIILFPGTSSDGNRVLPFKSSLFSLVEEPLLNGDVITVQPISITGVGLDGLPLGRTLRPYFSWYGDMDMTPHLWQSLKLGRFDVEVLFHASVTIRDFKDRKELCRYAENTIREGVGQLVSGQNSLPEGRAQNILDHPPSLLAKAGA
jgi:lyso-ornithine lipid O-acyltransferase